MKIGLIQTFVTENQAENFRKTAQLVKEAKQRGADAVCLQELFASPYFCQSPNQPPEIMPEAIPGTTSAFLCDLAQREGVIIIGGSFFERDGEQKYNTCLIIDEKGRIITKYRKVHIPEDPYYHEQRYFQSGNLGFVQAKIRTQGREVSLAPLIFYDQ